jgi:hypothetical protein
MHHAKEPALPRVADVGVRGERAVRRDADVARLADQQVDRVGGICVVGEQGLDDVAVTLAVRPGQGASGTRRTDTSAELRSLGRRQAKTGTTIEMLDAGRAWTFWPYSHLT